MIRSFALAFSFFASSFAGEPVELLRLLILLTVVDEASTVLEDAVSGNFAANAEGGVGTLEVFVSPLTAFQAVCGFVVSAVSCDVPDSATLEACWFRISGFFDSQDSAAIPDFGSPRDELLILTWF